MIAMSKSRLLEFIQNGYDRFRELLAQINLEQMTRPGTIGQWSVKDTVAHIVVHEQRMIEWMRERLAGAQPLAPQPYNMPDDELDELNEQIHRQNLARPLDDILCDLERTHVQVLALVDTSTEEDLLDPEFFQLQAGEPLWEAIAANTFWHYAEHGEDIRRLILKPNRPIP